MKPSLAEQQGTVARRLARRRLVALATLAALAVLLLGIASVSGARTLTSGIIGHARAIFGGARPALDDSDVVVRPRPAHRPRPRLKQARKVAPARGHRGGTQAPSSGPGPIAVEPAVPSLADSQPAPRASGEPEPPRSNPAPPVTRAPDVPRPKPGPPGDGEPESPPSEPPEPPEPPAEEPEPPPTEPPETPEPPPAEPPPPEPPGPSEPPPPVPGEEPFFEASRIGDFSRIEAAPGAVTEVPDPLGSGETVLKMTVGDDDVAPVTPTDNPRAQALSPDLIEPGDEFWLQTKFLIPQDFPTVNGWMSLVSIYGPPFSGSGPWQLEVVGDNLQWMRNRTYGFDVPWQVPLRKGVWVTLLLHERFASDGFVEMWIDGQQVTFFSGTGPNQGQQPATTRLQMQTVDGSNDGGPNSAKIMHYREAGMFETGAVYFGPLKLGDTRESVAG